jgi:peptide/nickel transport system substrate-binding protein
MDKSNKLKGMLACLSLLLFLTGFIPGIGTAAPKKTPPSADAPVTASEWAAKVGLDWGPKYWPTKPIRGGMSQTAGPLYIGLMNPNHWPVNDWGTISYFYDKLIWTDGSFKSTVPFLAESWKFLDPKTVVMKLRQGVLFHDGTPFNAESVKYQMDWIMDPANGAWTRAWVEPIASVEVVDTYTVKFNFDRPWASFAGVMSNVPGYMISTKALKADVAIRESKKLAGQVDREKKNVADAEKEVAAATGEAAEKAKAKLEAAKKKLALLEDQYKKAAALAEGAKPLDSHPVGTGQFMLDEGSPGNYLRIKRNPNWWFGKFIGYPDMPYFDGINISIIPDPSVRLANLRAGKINGMTLDPSQYPMVKNDRNLSVNLYNLNWVVGMRFNHKDGPCKDIRVRKAISHALDRKALINGVSFGLGDPASGPFPNQHWAHNPSLKPVAYNPELSKKLLAEAGYKKGLTIRGYMYNISSEQTMGEAIKNMLAKVGINWEVQFLDPAAASEKMNKVDYDFATNTWVWIYDPDLLLTGWYHTDGGFNFGRSNNKKVIPLIEAGRAEVDEAKRTKIYWEIEKLLYDNYEDVYISYPKAVNVFPKNIQGWNNDMYQKTKDVHWLTHPLWFKGGKR